MDNSILNSTKKILGISTEYTAFDLDIVTHINAAFSTAYQLGIGPSEVFTIEDDTATWNDIGLSPNLLSMMRSYIYLKTKMLFDPPTTSFHIEAANKQIEEFEWRMNSFREELIPSPEQRISGYAIVNNGDGTWSAVPVFSQEEEVV